MHGATDFLETAALLVSIALVLVALCARTGLPSIVGYLLAGLLIGPSGFGLITEAQSLSAIGELGVVLLLFTLGLEFSFEKLGSLKRPIFGMGATQVLLTTCLVVVALMLTTHLAPVSAVLMGGAVAMSSTALCVKILVSADALGSPQGRIAIAILLFQDLAAIFFLVLHDAVSAGAEGRGLVTLLGGIAALIAVIVVARRPLQRLASWAAYHGDPDLAQLLALSIALLAATAAIAIGLSPALGAFAAGIIISEGDARQIVEREVRPFRDLFVGVFFIAIGTQLRLLELSVEWPAVLLWLAVLTCFKFTIIVALVRWFGEQTEIALRSGVILAHGGEFGLMLLSVSMASGAISSEFGSPLLLAIGLSMAFASVLINSGAKGEKWLYRWRPEDQ